VCPRGHSYDVARGGYVNLLQPQDRRSAEAGDARAIVAARAALEQAGIGHELTVRLGDLVGRLPLATGAVVVDLGCGTGRALATITASGEYVPVGVDLSTVAISHASRKWPGVTWVVANADRRLPLLDGRADLVMSLHARRNPREAARVLAPGGALVLAVPAADDLIELRARVQGEATRRSRIEQVVAEHAPFFRVREQFTIREHRHLDRELLRQLLLTTYRGARTSVVGRLDALESLDVTLATDVLAMERG
jgi:23S rRNA (guanine745-N1)-methyltransferase